MYLNQLEHYVRVFAWLCIELHNKSEFNVFVLNHCVHISFIQKLYFLLTNNVGITVLGMYGMVVW